MLFSPFHPLRTAYYGTFFHPTGSIKGEAFYKKGLDLLDNTDAELQRMAYNGEIPKEYIKDLQYKRQKQNLMLEEGCNLGRLSDNITPAFLDIFPGIKQTAGRYNKFVFEQLIRGQMATSADILFDKNKAMLPELSDREIARRTVTEVNTRYGNLGSQGWIKSATGKDIARLITLAPEWEEGLLRSEWKSAAGLGETAKQALAGRFVMNQLTRSTLTSIAAIFAGSQLINFATRGKPTWENEEEGIGSKISAFVPNPFGQGGVFLNPLAITAELTNQFIQVLQRKKTLLGAADEVASFKEGPLLRSGMTGLRELSKGGSDWDAIKATGQGLIPAPIPGKAIVSAGKSIIGGKPIEDYPGQMERQLFATGGIKVDTAPLHEQRIYALADEFRKHYESKTGVKLPPKPPTAEGDYTELTHALRQDDTERADKAMKELVKIKETPAIFKYFQQYPHKTFLDNKKLEYQFKQTLNKEQLDAYDKAKENRLKIATKFREQYTPERVNELREE
jgi:hypothetical protein